MADCGDVASVGVISGISSGIGAGATALLTASSVAGGALAGFTFTAIFIGTVFAAKELGVENEIAQAALAILAGAAASVAAPSLLGYSITVGALTLVDLLIVAIGGAFIVYMGSSTAETG